MSCNEILNNSFDDFNHAYKNWYIQHNPNKFNIINPYIIYKKNKYGEENYVNEYLYDLKRFKLELLQINTSKLNSKDFYLYESINTNINELIFKKKFFQEYKWNPSYYSNISYQHFFNLLVNNELSLSKKNIYLIETLDYLPRYYDRTIKIINNTNQILIDKSIKEINKIINLINQIPYHLNLDDQTYAIVERKSIVCKKNLSAHIKTLQNIDVVESIKGKSFYFKKYDNYKMMLQDSYSALEIKESIQMSMKNIQDRIFQLTLKIYLASNDEPIWTDRNDTLDIILITLSHLKKYNDKKDYDSKIIKLDNSINDIVKFLKVNNILDINKNKYLDINYYNPNSMFNTSDNELELFNYLNNNKINMLYDDSNFNYISNVNQFIIEKILPISIFNSYNTKSIYENEFIQYAWGKILSRIVIENHFDEIDPNYELYYYLTLLQDYLSILIENDYYLENISKEDAITRLVNGAFINSTAAENIWNKIVTSNNYLLERYVTLLELSYLYDKHCILTRDTKEIDFLNKIFMYGYIPIKFYKSILD